MRLETCACLGGVENIGSAKKRSPGTRVVIRIWTSVRLAKRTAGWQCALSESGLYPGIYGQTMPAGPGCSIGTSDRRVSVTIPLGTRAERLCQRQPAAAASKRLEFAEAEARPQ